LTHRPLDVLGAQESETIALFLHFEQQAAGKMEQMVFALGMHGNSSAVPPLRVSKSQTLIRESRSEKTSAPAWLDLRQSRIAVKCSTCA
jgi:hypothetical protein